VLGNAFKRTKSSEGDAFGTLANDLFKKSIWSTSTLQLSLPRLELLVLTVAQKKDFQAGTRGVSISKLCPVARSHERSVLLQGVVSTTGRPSPRESGVYQVSVFDNTKKQSWIAGTERSV
jgi:ribosome modulation factor